MKKRTALVKTLSGALTLALLFLMSSSAPAQTSSSSSSLKKYMFEFQILLSDLQMLKGSESSTDWNAVDLKLKDLRQNIAAMQKSDAGGNYSKFLSTLSVQVGGLEGLARKKDPQVFGKIDPIAKTCLQCHSTHRALGITDTKH